MIYSKLLEAFFSYARGLRFKTLFYITLGLFVVNLITPDPIPLIDEILLGLGTLIFANLKKVQEERQTQKKTPNEQEKTKATDQKQKPGITIEGDYERKD